MQKSWIREQMPYYSAARRQRRRCERQTFARLAKLGKQMPECLNSLDTLLWLLERVGCCYEACPGKDAPHVIQRILSRGVSHTIAGIDLAARGHYDEALALARSVGEAGNLFWLFSIMPSKYSEWLSLDGKQRWNLFRPKKVREQIQGSGSPVPIDESRYSLLSEESSHPNPETVPQRFTPHLPTLGGYYQEAGVFVALNELAAPIAILGASAVALISEISEETRRNVRRAAVDVLHQVGSVGITELKHLRTGGTA